jgi:Protein of unknown function (DUF669)
MGKWDVDFDDYEEKEQSGYDGEVPKKGTYTADLISLGEHTSGAGNEGLEWIFEITEGDYKGWRGWVYSNMDTAKWKTQQIVKAISGGAEKAVKLDPGTDADSKTENKTVKKAKSVRIRVGRETYDDEPRAKIRTVMAMEAGEGGGKKKKKKGDDPF